MNRWLYLLLLAAPAAVLAEALHAPPLASFVLASLGLVPLAGLIGLATEVLAERLGHGIGGLLNATFGNSAPPEGEPIPPRRSVPVRVKIQPQVTGT